MKIIFGYPGTGKTMCTKLFPSLCEDLEMRNFECKEELAGKLLTLIKAHGHQPDYTVFLGLQYECLWAYRVASAWYEEQCKLGLATRRIIFVRGYVPKNCSVWNSVRLKDRSPRFRSHMKYCGAMVKRAFISNVHKEFPIKLVDTDFNMMKQIHWKSNTNKAFTASTPRSDFRLNGIRRGF